MNFTPKYCMNFTVYKLAKKFLSLQFDQTTIRPVFILTKNTKINSYNDTPFPILIVGWWISCFFCQLPSAADRVDKLCGRLWWKGKRKLIYCRELCVRQLGHYQDIFSQVITHAMSKHWLFNIPASHGQYQHIWAFQNIHGL